MSTAAPTPPVPSPPSASERRSPKPCLLVRPWSRWSRRSSPTDSPGPTNLEVARQGRGAPSGVGAVPATIGVDHGARRWPPTRERGPSHADAAGKASRARLPTGAVKGERRDDVAATALPGRAAGIGRLLDGRPRWGPPRRRDLRRVRGPDDLADLPLVVVSSGRSRSSTSPPRSSFETLSLAVVGYRTDRLSRLLHRGLRLPG